MKIVSPRNAVSKSALKRSAPAGSTPAGSTPGLSTPDAKTAGERQRIRPETRAQMLERLTNPQISLHETSVILRVCTATVRNYCNAGYLPHDRTPGGQRRFRLNEVLAFLQEREEEKNGSGFRVQSSRLNNSPRGRLGTRNPEP